MNSVRALRAPSLSRRSFLVACAASGGGLMIGWVPAADATGEDVFAPNAFIRLDRAGKVTVISPAVEMGQGTYTSLSMLIAEELDVDMANVSVDHAPANDKLYGNPIISGVQMTGGSTTIRAFYLPLRRGGCGGARNADCGGGKRPQSRGQHVVDRAGLRNPHAEREEDRVWGSRGRSSSSAGAGGCQAPKTRASFGSSALRQSVSTFPVRSMAPRFTGSTSSCPT